MTIIVDWDVNLKPNKNPGKTLIRLLLQSDLGRAVCLGHFGRQLKIKTLEHLLHRPRNGFGNKYLGTSFYFTGH